MAQGTGQGAPRGGKVLVGSSVGSRNFTNVTITSSLQTRQVIVTPLTTSPAHATQPYSANVIKKVLLKAVSKSNKKDPKTFTLRNIQSSHISTCHELKFLIRAQLQEDMIKEDFDVGYLQNSTVISIRSTDDLLEVWENIRRGKNITLWCDGMKSASGKRLLDADSDNESEVGRRVKPAKRKKHEEKEDQVDNIISDLKKKT